MTEIGDTINQALTRISFDRRRTANQYLNIEARPGNASTPRRLMSEIGFLEERQFSYVAPHAANVTYDDTAGPRAIKQIVLVAYGVRSDYRRLVSTAPLDRNVRTLGSAGTSGVLPYPTSDQVLMSGALDAETYSAQKTALVVRGLTSTQGPAPHFIVNRRGDIIVGPGIDGETSVLFAYADTGIFIAVESALAIAREDHAARRFDRIVELPLASVQLITLGVLVNKLMTALGSSVPATFYDNLSATAAGFTYGWVDTLEGVSPYNFRQRPKPAPHPALRFDYSTSTGPDFFSSVVLAQGSFNLATDIWRPLAAPRPIAGREEVRAALGSVDTAGAESVYMGNYATLAAGERSSEMQTTQRAQMFVQRMRVSHTGADEAATQAANATETGTSTVLPNEEPANVGPHTYDFATGRWGDNSPF